MLSADRADATELPLERAGQRLALAAPRVLDHAATRGQGAGDAVQRETVGSLEHARPTTSDVARQELALLAVAARARCPDRAVDEERVALLGEVYAAGLEVARQLRDHTLHSVAEYRGSHSAWDVLAEGEALAAAQERYAAVAKCAVARLPAILSTALPPR